MLSLTAIRVAIRAAKRPDHSKGPGLSGAKGQNRTADTAVFSRVLYRLSYLGVGEAGLEPATSSV